MTTVYMSERNCFVCGETSTFPHGNLTSMGGVGLRDLDGRPTHILRSSVYLWIQRCPSCGYCAPEIAAGEHADLEFLQNDTYRNQLNNSSYPETADSFLCHSLVMEHRNLFANAAWAAVFSAWICDDNDYVDGALLCRQKAISLFAAARDHAIMFAESTEQEELYLIDLYRRCGDFSTAHSSCDAAIGRKPADNILDLLYLEKDLVEKKDSTIHNDGDVEELL